MYVYVLKNEVNGKCYVGQTTRANPFLRVWEHFAPGAKGSIIHRAIEKHGMQHFSTRILFEAASQDELNRLERVAITIYNSVSPHGYNLQTGGDAGGKLAEEVLQKRYKAVTATNIITGDTLSFASIKEASIALHIPTTNIARICKGRTPRKEAGGYTFTYVKKH